MSGPAASGSRVGHRTPDVVKSAVRVLEVLEYFDACRHPACVGSIATALGFPQSSTSALLRSLVKVGYLRYDPHGRTYAPTIRVSLLGNWIGWALSRGSPLVKLAESLAGHAGLPVLLARRTGCQAQYVHIASDGGASPPGIKLGAMQSLTRCAVGHVLLATLEEPDVRRLLHRLNAETTSQHVVPVSGFLAKLETIRRASFTILGEDDCAVLAICLPNGAAAEPLALGFAGSVAALKKRQAGLLRLLWEEMRVFLQPAPPALADFDVPAAFALRQPRPEAGPCRVAKRPAPPQHS